jgi:hypothetical protein
VKTAFRSGFAIALTVIVCGCTTPFKPAGISPDAADLLSRAARTNTGLKSLKGLGTLDAERSGKRFQARVAWVCQPPDRFRITVLGGLGRPSASLASDGRHISYLSHDSGEFKQWPQGATFPMMALPIAVAPADVAEVLSGRVPVKAHDAAATDAGGDPDGQRLVLKRWGRIVQDMAFEENDVHPSRFSAYTEHGDLAYAVSYGDFLNVNGYRLPGRTDIAGNDGSRLTLKADRYWTDVAVDPAVFVITPK